MVDGPKYAKRITPIKSSANTDAELSYVGRHEAAAQTAATSEPEPESLPQTAGNQGMIALVGFLALGAAGAVAIGRRLYAS